MNLLWVDANGLVLGTVVATDYVASFPQYPYGLLLDGNGFIWSVTWEGDVYALSSQYLVRWYTSTDCTGLAYVSEPSNPPPPRPIRELDRPRWVVSLTGVTGFFAAGDQQRREDIVAHSSFEGSPAPRCMGPYSDTHIAGMRLDRMRSVPPLTINPVGPVHVEQR
jgi:hypothetical protein